MNLFNRLLVILLALALLLGAGGVLLTTLRVAQPAQLAPGAWFTDRLLPFTQLDPTVWAWTVGVSLGLVALALILLYVELRPEPRPAPRIVLKQDDLGRVTVSLESVRALVDREAGRVEGVRSARSQVDQESDGLRVLSHIAVDPASSVPDMTQELQLRLKGVVQHYVGLAVTGVSIDAQVAPLRTDQRPRRRVQ